MYIWKLNKELLDLGAIEMDDGLIGLCNTHGFVEQVAFIKEDETRRVFKVNLEEKLIQGRGIKGFFNDYQGEHVLIDIVAEGFQIFAPQKVSKEWKQKLEGSLETKERIFEIVEAMNAFKNQDPEWFKIYLDAQEFGTRSNTDELACLPHIQDINLYEYQLKAVKAVFKRFHGRVLLCDEVGLGKTIEAGIAMMEYIMRGLAKKILILVPPSLVDQWYFEMKRKFNQDFIRADDPEFKSKGDKAWEQYNKVIASISTAKRKQNSEIIGRIHYDLVIVDEAHHLKNNKTVAWKFVNSLHKKYIFLLTATPVQNNLEELYNLITLLKPGQLKTYSYFKKQFISDKEGLEAKNVARLREMLAGVMIRNKRSNVDIKFTKRKATTMSVSLQPQEYELYESISSFIRSRYHTEGSTLTRFVLKSLQEQMGSSFFALLPTLEKLAVNEKLTNADRDEIGDFYETAKAIVENKAHSNRKALQLAKIVKEFNDKMVIFTKYRATQEYLIGFLREQNFKVAVFNGSMKRKEKEAQIEYFKSEAQLLISTEAGGEGRNLQFCNGLINYDLPWNPMAIEQRIGRIHRVGQTRDIFVYNLAAKDTVEYYILDLLDRKINMFELVVGEVDMILGDIEEEADFSDMIMDAWVRADTTEKMEEEISVIGEKLLENKKQYMKVNELDEKLFGDIPEEEGM